MTALKGKGPDYASVRAGVARRARRRFSLSADEARADAKLSKLRELVVDAQAEAPGAGAISARSFIDVDQAGARAVREQIAASALYRYFLRAMPKGAMLHVHAAALGSYGELLRAAVASKKKWYFDERAAEPERTFVTQPASAAYQLLTAGTVDKALSMLTLTSRDLTRAGEVCAVFMPIFARLRPLLHDPELGGIYFDKAFAFLASEGTQHVELRTAWRPPKETTPGSKEWNILAAARKHGVSLRVIYSKARQLPADEVQTQVTKVASWLGRGGDEGTLVGYDLVKERAGEEGTRRASEALFEGLAQVKAGSKPAVFPVFFHGGEFEGLEPGGERTPAEVHESTDLIDARALHGFEVAGVRITVPRVGHGLELFKLPKLMNAMARAGEPGESGLAGAQAIELCPIRDQVLGIVGDLREHPGQTYLEAGVPVTLNPDDPALYAYEGLSFDFWQACIAWGLGLGELKQLCLDSLRYSALGGAAKDAAIARWERAWAEFIGGQREPWPWTKVPGVVQHKWSARGAVWPSCVHRQPVGSVAEAKAVATQHEAVTYFFLTRAALYLESGEGCAAKGDFEPGEAVFFEGEPTWAPAPEADGYLMLARI